MAGTKKATLPLATGRHQADIAKASERATLRALEQVLQAASSICPGGREGTLGRVFSAIVEAQRRCQEVTIG